MAETRTIPLERLEFETMASGSQLLLLTEQVNWIEFPRYAERVVSYLEGAITHRADSAAERVWTATIRGGAFWISFDDFPLGVSLDPQDADAARLLPDIRDALLSLRDR